MEGTKKRGWKQVDNETRSLEESELERTQFVLHQDIIKGKKYY